MINDPNSALIGFVCFVLFVIGYSLIVIRFMKIYRNSKVRKAMRRG